MNADVEPLEDVDDPVLDRVVDKIEPVVGLVEGCDVEIDVALLEEEIEVKMTIDPEEVLASELS